MFRVWAFWGLGLRVQDLGVKGYISVQDLGFQGLGFRV